MSTQKSNLSHALSPRYAESAKKATPFMTSPTSAAAGVHSSSSSSSSKTVLSQSAPVRSGFLLHGVFPAQPIVRPVEAPPSEPPALTLPTSLPDSETALDVWQVDDKLGRSFYSSSMPANLSVRGMFGGRAERDAAAAVTLSSDAPSGRRRASSSTSTLSSSVNATIFGFMSGGSATDPSALEAAARSGALGVPPAMSQSLSSSPAARFNRFRESIAEETSAGFDDSDDENAAVRNKKDVASGKKGIARHDSGDDGLQFSLALDEEL